MRNTIKWKKIKHTSHQETRISNVFDMEINKVIQFLLKPIFFKTRTISYNCINNQKINKLIIL